MIKIFVISLCTLLFSCTFTAPYIASTESAKTKIKTDKKTPSIKVKTKNGILSISLEKYVAGVLQGEVIPSWPIETLKAQAVASRTYALKKMIERKNSDYHVVASTDDQVYKKNPHANFKKAVYETRGLILQYNGMPIESSFHSSCGGHTESAKEVFNVSYPYLAAKKCEYCHNAPGSNWQTSISKKKIEKILKKPITKVVIADRSTSGRAKMIDFGSGKISAHSLRMKISPMKIKSTKITSIKTDKDHVIIRGEGFGHGVGMCQWGAERMGKAGKSFAEILKKYYQSTTLTKKY